MSKHVLKPTMEENSFKIQFLDGPLQGKTVIVGGFEVVGDQMKFFAIGEDIELVEADFDVLKDEMTDIFNDMYSDQLDIDMIE